jgi:hypothetical protein
MPIISRVTGFLKASAAILSRNHHFYVRGGLCGIFQDSEKTVKINHLSCLTVKPAEKAAINTSE